MGGYEVTELRDDVEGLLASVVVEGRLPGNRGEEHELPADTVVVAHPAAREGESEDAVEQHRMLNQSSVLARYVIGVVGAGDPHRLPVCGQVAAQLLE